MNESDSSRAAKDAEDVEDKARAQWYALISRLFYAPPDAPLLLSVTSVAGGEDAASDCPLVAEWHSLQAACRSADLEAARAEFDDLFVGVGKAQVTPYSSSYAAPHAPDRHLLALRTRLGAWGLARREQVFETEDHVSAICDAMRWLIEQGHPLDDQRAYFNEFVDPALPAFCAAINRSPTAAFYRCAGSLSAAFIAIEREAFDMHTES